MTRAADLVLSLTGSDLRARYGRGPWRALKWLLDPFALVGVYLVLVTVVLDRGGPAPGLSLVCAVVPFQILMLVVNNALGAVKLRGSILGNSAFPGMLLPLSATLTETLAFGASLLLVVGMMIAYAVPPTVAALALPAVMAVNVALAASFAYPATLLGIWVPDLKPFMVSLVRTMFFLAPGLVALETITGTASELIKLNPLTGLFEGYRAILLDGVLPAAWMLAYPLLFSAVVALAFLPVYRSEQRHFAKVME